METNQPKPKSTPGKVFLVPTLILLAIAYFGFLLYEAVYVNYQTNKKIDQGNISILKLQGDQQNLKDLISYYQTSAFQELEARKKLGLKMPGEKVVKVQVPQAKRTVEPEEVAPIGNRESNPSLWLKFLSGGNF